MNQTILFTPSTGTLAVPKGDEALSVEKFRAYNERKLKDWLYHISDYHEQAYKATQDEVARTDEGEGDVIGVWVRKVLDDDPPGTRNSHTILTDATGYLKAKHWPLYMRLMPAFFNGVASEPWLPEIWESEGADGSLPDSMAYQDYLEAIVYMMDYIETRLPLYKRTDETGYGLPMSKLTVPVPSTVRYRRRSTLRKRRRDALELVQKYRQDLEDAVAIRLAAAHSGYSEKEIRTLIRQYDKGKL